LIPEKMFLVGRKRFYPVYGSQKEISNENGSTCTIIIQNERCDTAVHSVVNRCFYEKEEGSFMKILRV
jgi:hypothetical protein